MIFEKCVGETLSNKNIDPIIKIVNELFSTLCNSGNSKGDNIVEYTLDNYSPKIIICKKKKEKKKKKKKEKEKKKEKKKLIV